MNYVHVPDYQYLVAAADPCECDRLPKPVQEREPGSHRRGGDCSDGGEYGGCGDIL